MNSSPVKGPSVLWRNSGSQDWGAETEQDEAGASYSSGKQESTTKIKATMMSVCKRGMGTT